MSLKQSAWPAYYRELLAIYESVKYFRHIVEAQPCTIFTDHKPLVYAFTQRREKIPPTQLNQLTFISEFTTDIQHIKGDENIVADTMSRIEVVSLPLDYQALAASQDTDDELKHFTDNNSSLHLEKVLVPGSSAYIYCDTSTGRPRPFLPQRFRRHAFDQLHNLSHPGARATAHLVSERFVWPAMKKDCRSWARACVHCQRSKISRHVSAPLGNFETPSRRFKHVHVDIIGPLPPSQSFRYCLTVIDRFTRWPEVYPLERITADDVTKGFLNCWISRFGVPQYVTTDRGTQFVSATLKTLAKRFGFTLRPTTSWHPAANGFVERMHRQLKAAIMAHAKDSWTESLPIVLLGIRSAFKEDLKATSAELVYGEPLNLPGDFFTDNQDNSSTNDPTSLLDRLRSVMNKIRPVPASRHSNPRSFVFADLKDCSHVFLREGGVRAALQPPYQGPYEVIARNDKTFTIKVRNQPVTVTIDRVKPAYLMVNESTTDSQAHAPPATAPNTPKQKQPPNTDPSTQPVRTTRSGRRVRFPDIFDPS